LENRLAIIKVHKHLPYNLPIPLWEKQILFTQEK
jgi:hypothetical protein